MYVVTGASGHIGNTLIRMLVEQGKADQVVAMLHSNKEPRSLKGLPVKRAYGDIRPASIGYPAVHSRGSRLGAGG